MKRIIFLLLALMMFSTANYAQSSNPPQFTQQTDANYRLYPTQNMYNFLKLDTRNGKIDIVQWSTSSNRMERTLSSTSQVLNAEDEKPGRFTLYATSNMYNFIMLDQVDGRTWQVQWDINSYNCMVIRIY